MKRRLSVFLLAVMATFVFAGCSSNDPVKTTPEAVPATQVPNDADQGGGAGGTNDENNDGTPDSTRTRMSGWKTAWTTSSRTWRTG